MIIQEFVQTFRFALQHDSYWNIRNKLKDLRKALHDNGLMARFWAVAGITIATATIADFGLETARAVDKLGDLGEKLGLSAQEMQEWQYAAQQSAVDIESFEVAIKQFGRSVGDAAAGKAPKVMQRFLELGKIVGKSGAEMVGSGSAPRAWKDVFLDVADAFSKMTDEQKNSQLAIALKLMGRTGEEMIQLLNLGAGRIEDFFAEARSIGHEITEEERKRADLVIKSWDRIKFRLKSLAFETFSAIAPMFEGVIATIEDLLKIFMVFARALSRVRKVVSDYFAGIGLDAERFGWMLKMILAPVLMSTIGLVYRLIKVFFGFGGAMAFVGRTLIPFLAMLAILALIGDEINVTMRGGKSLANEFDKWIHSIDPEDNAIVAMLKTTLRLTQDILALFAGLLTGDGNTIEQAFKGIIAGVVAAVMDASQIVVDLVLWTTKAFAFLLDMLGDQNWSSKVSQLMSEFDAFSAQAKRQMYRDVTGYDPKTGAPVQTNNVKIDVNVPAGADAKRIAEETRKAFESIDYPPLFGAARQAVW